MINLGPVTEREALTIIAAIQDEDPELAHVLRKRYDHARTPIIPAPRLDDDRRRNITARSR